MPSLDPAIRDHKAWLGYVQQEGLVVSPAALVDAQVVLDRNTLSLQERFLASVREVAVGEDGRMPAIGDFRGFVREFLEWPDEALHGLEPGRPVPEALSVALPDYGETLAPSFALRDAKPKEPEQPWLLVGQSLEMGTDLDARTAADERGWSASPTQRLERLLREIRVPIGLLFNGTALRLVYAPHGENSGNLTFQVGHMTEVAGRPILAALNMLLGEACSAATPSESRLPALLRRSRDYQSTVSTQLAGQVLDALYELLRGFQAADEKARGDLLRSVLVADPDQVYSGLLTVLMRLVFLLFAEDRGIVPTDPKSKRATGIYVRHYSVHGLFERLRADAERYPDTMDQRYGAWAQLLALFRAVHDGCRHPQMRMPPRRGNLFDSDRFPFLEGRTSPATQLPLVSDGILYRVLQNLLILDGERLSYRTLDVEEIGSVYQTVMGFRLEVATGPSIAIKGRAKKGGVPAATVIPLSELLAAAGRDRPKWLAERTDQELSGDAEKALTNAATVDDLLAALERRIARNATPAPVAKGGLVLQPTDERRRSGSHYTPRSFTEPIVRKTLEPVLRRFGAQPKPEEILGLKICDLAVGSAAFLVETCRQLAEELPKAWRHHGGRPPIPPDEDEYLLAMRLIAQRCLYGVDRNPMAVDLAKLSLWLATLAKDHPFTFLDHAIRAGDSLVGLTRRQIEGFTWHSEIQTLLFAKDVNQRTAAALRERQNLLGMGDDYGTPQLKREKLEKADELLNLVRFIGDAAVTAYFSADKDEAREQKRVELAERIAAYLDKGDLRQRPTAEVDALRSGRFQVRPFHWEIEFPEVFERANRGFDVFVGNPPYAGKNTLINANREGYLSWLKVLHEEAHGNADLVAHFFRRAFGLLRRDGCLGLIATKTIRQGDTRSTGLRWICLHGGTIYAARRRYKWPGQAAVVVSVVHISRAELLGPFDLDGVTVRIITAYLFHDGGHDDPAVIDTNREKSFQGSIPLGMGFTFDDTDPDGVCSPISEMETLISRNPTNAERVFPYIGGEEVNDSPNHAHHRFAISFADWPLRREDVGASWADESRRRTWIRSGRVPNDYPGPVAADYPDLLEIVERKVKPQRDHDKREVRRKYWWRYGEGAPALYTAIEGMERVLAINCGATPHMSFVFLPARMIFANTLDIFSIQELRPFTVLQSRIHESWARFFASSMKDDLRYTPTDCFETFPFPAGVETNAALEAAGRVYYEFRAALMQDLWLGLTEVYNLFHSPDDEALARLETLYRKRAASSDWRTAEAVPADRSPLALYATPAAALAAVQRLRTLHAAMDAAVLTAYGWADLLPRCTCEFLLDYQDEDHEEDEAKTRRRKKPWRYRWPDEVRDEVLARLLKLNAERAKAEMLVGEATTGPSAAGRRKPGKRGKPPPGSPPTQSDLIPPPQGDLFA